MMPVETRAERRRQGMEQSQDKGKESAGSRKDQFSPKPVRKSFPTTDSAVRQRKTKDTELQKERKNYRSQSDDEDSSGENDTVNRSGVATEKDQGYDEPDSGVHGETNETKVPHDTVPHKTKTQTETQKEHKLSSGTVGSNFNTVLRVAVIICVAAGLSVSGFVLRAMYTPASEPMNIADVRSEFEASLQELRGGFPSQEQHVWDTVGATVSGHLRSGSHPERPIVLLFGSHPNASDTTTCLAERLGKLLSKTLRERNAAVTQIDGKEFRHETADDAKLKMDNQLQAGFENGGKAAVILNLDAFPPCSILLFHGYCENENALYKDAALIFTVTLDDEDRSHQDVARSKPLNFRIRAEFLISEHLTRAWSGKCLKLPEEKVEAMLSRVANNVGIVKKEESLPC